jgi:hypothetical protein
MLYMYLCMHIEILRMGVSTLPLSEKPRGTSKHRNMPQHQKGRIMVVWHYILKFIVWGFLHCLCKRITEEASK